MESLKFEIEWDYVKLKFIKIHSVRYKMDILIFF